MEIFFKLTISTLYIQFIHCQLECSPIDHEIHLYKSSSKNLNIRCDLTGCIQNNIFIIFLIFISVKKASNFSGSWVIDRVTNSPKSFIKTQTRVTENSTMKTISFNSEVFVDQRSSLMKSIVRLTLAVSVDGLELRNVVYRISCGSDSSLILICVFSCVGALSITGALISLLAIKRRRRAQPASPVSATNIDDVWSDVDLTDGSHLANSGFQVVKQDQSEI